MGVPNAPSKGRRLPSGGSLRLLELLPQPSILVSQAIPLPLQALGFPLQPVGVLLQLLGARTPLIAVLP